MKIGFIKLGLKTYFKKNGTGQGSNHELVNIFNLFQKHNHKCFMLSNSDKYKTYQNIKNLDWIFMFNGPSTLYGGKRTVMLQNYFQIYCDLINSTNVPFIYFWTDSRKEYNISINHNFQRKPNIILSQEKENYGHLEKIILIEKENQFKKEKNKEIKFGVLMNSTNPKRDKEIIKFFKWMEKGEIRGNWKNKNNEWLKESIPENNVDNYLSKVKYTVNITTNYWWINQKYYEYILNDVICFNYLADGNNLVMSKDDFRQIRDEVELDEKITLLEKDIALYRTVLNNQKAELKKEYFDGSFIYNFINNKIKNYEKI